MEITMKDLPFGQIVSITGMSFTIEIYPRVLENNLEQSKVIGPGNNLTLPVGTVGDIFLIGGPSTHHVIHYAIFEEIKLVSSLEPGPNNGVFTEKSKAVIVAKVIGYQDPKIRGSLQFKRGVGHYPKFNSKCFLITPEEKRQLFALNEMDGIVIGKISGVQDEDVAIHINKFLGKHSVVLGSTGSGKSYTVASILQNILKAHPFSHVIFFDPHDEYTSAFPNKRGKYKVNKVNAKDLKLPYWLLNFDEFQNIFLGEVDPLKNSNGFRILKEEVIRLKDANNKVPDHSIGSIERVNINAPLYYSFDDLLLLLENLNKRTLWKSDNEPAINPENDKYLPGTGNRNIDRGGVNDNVIQDSNYYGELEQIIEKLKSIKSDRRYEFLFSDVYEHTLSFYEYMEKLLSIPKNTIQNQMTIIDLSTVPSEVVPIVIGVLSRLCFEYKIWEPNPHKVPLYLVLEEAHNYIPRDTNNVTKLTKKYIGRIAKEGRKYGVNLMIVSQRPSDLCETIISQCSNFFILRVTNPNDQSFIQHVMPDHLNALSVMIPFFQNGECLIAGECVTIPTKVIITPPNPEPSSRDVEYSKAWKKAVKDYRVDLAIKRWWDVN